jgi:hypothetical protein
MPEALKENDEYVIVEDEKNLTHNDDDDDINPDHPDDDDRVASTARTDENDTDREAIRERRRIEKIERKQRRDTAINRDKTELEFLRKQNELLERRMAAQEYRAQQSDVLSLAQQAQQAKNQAQQAERVIAKAVEAGNGNDVAQAMRYRDEAMQRAQQLNYAAQQAQQRQPSPVSSGPDERVMAHARKFIDENKWYDPQGRDEESAIVLAIDQALVKDGFAPHTEEYWGELKKRAARRLPDRFASASSDRVARGGPAMASGREHAPASTRNEVYISPERKSALIEAGVWDDPVLRQKYVKRYAEYDKQNRA